MEGFCLGFRGLGFRGLGFRVLGLRGFFNRNLPWTGLLDNHATAPRSSLNRVPAPSPQPETLIPTFVPLRGSDEVTSQPKRLHALDSWCMGLTEGRWGSRQTAGDCGKDGLYRTTDKTFQV